MGRIRMLVASSAVAGVILLTAGCDASRGVIPVEGRISFAGQPPPSPGYVYFVPLDGKAGGADDDTRPRAGTAIFTPDGMFTVTTFKQHDGLRPGRYEARVECSFPAEAHSAAKTAVPPGFKPPEVTVSTEGPRPARVEIDVR